MQFFTTSCPKNNDEIGNVWNVDQNEKTDGKSIKGI